MKDRIEIEKIYIFDMDNTILKNPQKEDCERVWLEKFNTKWPHKGIYSKPESLDFTIFNIPTIPHVIEEYNKVKDEGNIHNVILTGRLIKLQKEVMSLLDYHNLYFDEYLLNNKIYQTRFVKQDGSDKRNVSYPVSKKVLSQFEIPTDLKIYAD